MNFTKNIIHRGIQELIIDNDEFFKQNLIYALSSKLNESIQTIKQESQQNLLKEKFQNTEITESVEQFVEFINSYEEHKNHRLILKNKAVINITESEIRALKILFESLSNKNRQNMAKSIFENPENLKNHVEFYNQVKGLI